jgi:hypothetical protein
MGIRGTMAILTADIALRVYRRDYIFLIVYMAYKAPAVIGNWPGIQAWIFVALAVLQKQRRFLPDSFGQQ